MRIPFEKVLDTISFYSPLAGMKRVEGLAERRKDPLTGRYAVTSTFISAKKEILFPPTDWDHLKKIAYESEGGCFFCPAKVEQVTPRYLEKWLPEGRLHKGECILFPNLFPVASIHAVIVLGKKHFRFLNDFPAPLLTDGFEAALDFTRAVYGEDPGYRFFTLNANYLSPSGASAIHPHLQLLGGRSPFAESEKILKGCKRFKDDKGVDYFDLLLEQEKNDKERYVATTGAVSWLVPFAPGGTNEVVGLLPGCNDLLTLDHDAMAGLTSGLSRILAFYYGQGFSSFNFTLYSGPLGKENPHPVFIRVICRQNVYPDYRTDDYFIQKLLGEEIMLFSPEETAAALRELFENP